MTLKELNIGKTAVIKAVGGDGPLRQHFLDMGVIPGTLHNFNEIRSDGRSDGAYDSRL